jgi:hypothetical protein
MRLLIRDIFDPRRGWNYAPEDILLREEYDGEVLYYVVVLYGVVMAVYQTANPWGEGWPDLVVVASTLEGPSEYDPTSLLGCNSAAAGFPSIGVDEDGQTVVQASFPLSPNFPVYLARKQVVTCLGAVASRVSELLEPPPQVWNETFAVQEEAGPTGPGMADKAARFVGTVIGRIIKEGMRDD